MAAAEKLRRINSAVEIEPIVADVTHANIAKLAADVDVIVDGTDNFATRFLVNDFAVKHDKPWVYGGCIGAEGQSMTIVPHDTACLACLLPEPPPPGTTPTCDTAGILGPVVGVIGSIEASEAMKILSGHAEAISRSLTVVEMWDNRLRQVDRIEAPRHERLPRLPARRVPLAQRRAERRLGRALRAQRRADRRPGGDADFARRIGGAARGRGADRAKFVSCCG